MLLSIIIPTKNRQYTALFAIESAMMIPEKDVEIIVEDCSDEPLLATELKAKFGSDERLQYHYSDDKPSMTENWNRAFERSSGQYVIGIGDDDAVLPEIYKVAKLGLEYDAPAIVHSAPYSYTWPGFYQQVHNGTFTVRNSFSGTLTWKDDFNKRVRKYGSLREPMSYMDLPSIYHALVSRNLLNQLKAETGKLLDSTALDIYTAIAFSKYINKYLFCDYPFSIKGASSKSNSQRLFTKKTKEHFKEFKKLDLPDVLPSVPSLVVAAAESYITACHNTNRDELISLIDLPALYATITIEDDSLRDICLTKLKTYSPGEASLRRFEELVQQGSIKNDRSTFYNKCILFIKKRIPFIYKIYTILTPAKSASRFKTYKAPDIITGLKRIHSHYLRSNNIKLQNEKINLDAIA